MNIHEDHTNEQYLYTEYQQDFSDFQYQDYHKDSHMNVEPILSTSDSEHSMNMIRASTISPTRNPDNHSFYFSGTFPLPPQSLTQHLDYKIEAITTLLIRNHPDPSR